jgi:hypothetical protein
MNTLQPFQQRVVDEHAELQARLHKLLDFLYDAEKVEQLSESEQFLLREQSHTMHQYLGILEQRIELFT